MKMYANWYEDDEDNWNCPADENGHYVVEDHDPTQDPTGGWG